ncbi:MAG: rhamnogalacturonan lyase [Paludibacter sp.]|nr:rhamnogalacturonan lyase [Paludibacter sp.]
MKLTKSTFTLFILCFSTGIFAQRQMEYLNRGVIAMRADSTTAYISWRLLGNDSEKIAFDVYRTTGNKPAEKLNAKPIEESTQFVDKTVDFSQNNTYTIKPVNGSGKEEEGSYSLTANAPVRNYLSIPVKPIPGYNIGDGSVGDLDGDGQYEIIIKREMRPMDNSHPGITGQTKLEAYKLDGTFMWRIDLGKNIREGAHYTQFMVYDLDGDGRAEIACKTADGTIDGTGKVIGDSTADHRNAGGNIYKGPEYLTIFDGKTGAALATTNYIPGRYPGKQDPTPEEMNDIWGDNHYNRSERYLACIAYLDGVHPSLVMCRGYYTRAVLAAWNWRKGKLTNVWTFDSDDKTPGNRAYRGQGAHNLSVADVDSDGKDEIIYGACCIDHNGKGLYSTGLGHGDAVHLSDLDPQHPGLEVWMGHESQSDVAGCEFREAATGKLLWGFPSSGDVGRALTANIDPRHPGYECWAFGPGMSGLYSAKGEKISNKAPRTCNFTVYWDGDLQQELLDKNYVAKYNWNKDSLEIVMQARECKSINGTKADPVVSADLFGDWREEIVWRTIDNTQLRIYSTTIPTEHRLVTFMHDPVYRLAIAWQNVAYNQPPTTSYYIGDDMAEPPKPNLYVVKYSGNR